MANSLDVGAVVDIHTSFGYQSRAAPFCEELVFVLGAAAAPRQELLDGSNLRTRSLERMVWQAVHLDQTVKRLNGQVLLTCGTGANAAAAVQQTPGEPATVVVTGGRVEAGERVTRATGDHNDGRSIAGL